jgi:hypothetical protein
MRYYLRSRKRISASAPERRPRNNLWSGLRGSGRCVGIVTSGFFLSGRPKKQQVRDIAFSAVPAASLYFARTQVKARGRQSSRAERKRGSDAFPGQYRGSSLACQHYGRVLINHPVCVRFRATRTFEPTYPVIRVGMDRPCRGSAALALPGEAAHHGDGTLIHSHVDRLLR